MNIPDRPIPRWVIEKNDSEFEDYEDYLSSKADDDYAASKQQGAWEE